MSSTTKLDFDNPPAKTIKPIHLAHVVLRTHPSKIKQLQQFYLTFLGGTLQYESDNLSFMTYDEEHHRIALVGIPGTGDKVQTTCGLEHIAFTFATLGDLMMAYRQRLRAGMEPFWCVNHGPTISLYYRDLDGNILETQFNCFDTAQGATDFMLGPEYAENPIGVDFDPEELIEKIQGGVGEEELKKRANIGPRGIPEF